MAFAEVRRRSKESTNFTVHVSGTRRPGNMSGCERDFYMRMLFIVDFNLKAERSMQISLSPLNNNNPHL